MPDQDSSLQVFVYDTAGDSSIALLLRNPAIVEHEGSLVPVCQLTTHEAMRLAMALARCAEHIQSSQRGF